VIEGRAVWQHQTEVDAGAGHARNRRNILIPSREIDVGLDEQAP
jgi:hypothetical protein